MIPVRIAMATGWLERDLFLLGDGWLRKFFAD
jgi:hypothetical protein